MDPSLKKAFPKDTGIDLTYDEDINSNNEYFAKIRPNLSKDQSIDRDGFVLTDWMANRLINQVKWVQKFDEAAFPNKANLRTALEVAVVRPHPLVQRAVGERRHRDRLQHRHHRQGDPARSTTSSR